MNASLEREGERRARERGGGGGSLSARVPSSAHFLPATRPHPRPPPQLHAGYYGRPFEARNKARGGAFVGADKDFLRFSLGDGSVVAGFEEAITGMRPGGVRRVIVPVELGYPGGDFKNIGPKPTTFSVRGGTHGGGEAEEVLGRGCFFSLHLLSLKPQRSPPSPPPPPIPRASAPCPSC